MKMKKVSVAVLLCALCTIFLCFGFSRQAAFAAVSESECDRVFYETVNELATKRGGEVIGASKTLLYNVDLVEAAMLYDFSVGGREGFCIVLYTDGKYAVSEFYPEGQNPYDDAQGLPIYLTSMTYADYRADGLYYIGGIGADKETILNEIDVYYGEGYGTETITTTISYVSKTTDEQNLAAMVPSIKFSPLSNACVPITGANLIAYYDRFAPNLIPNYEPGRLSGTNYWYDISNVVSNSLITTLSGDMQHNSSTGTTYNNFISGMNAYVSARGYTVSYEDCKKNGVFNYNKTRDILKTGRPVALFVRKHQISWMNSSPSTGVDEFVTMITSGAHAMTIFGYRDVLYTAANGRPSQERFLYVASGNGTMGNCYLNPFQNFVCDFITAIDID